VTPPPINTLGNDAPPRVQIVVSPLGVQSTATSQKSGNTTNTTCYGETKFKSKIQFVTGHDSINN
jgi:hypothetical protein